MGNITFKKEKKYHSRFTIVYLHILREKYAYKLEIDKKIDLAITDEKFCILFCRNHFGTFLAM